MKSKAPASIQVLPARFETAFNPQWGEEKSRTRTNAGLMINQVKSVRMKFIIQTELLGLR